MNSFIAILAILVAGIVGPGVMALLTNRQRRQEKKEDWAREDAVKEKAEEAARLLAERQNMATAAVAHAAALLVEQQDQVRAQAAEAARLLVESDRRTALTTVVTNGKLDLIHTLVNSQMTTAMQEQLDQTVTSLALMREVVALHEADGRTASVEALATIEATEVKVRELRAALADRLSETQRADVEAASAEALEAIKDAIVAGPDAAARPA